MFSPVQFSRVFPYIHPRLFPIETAKSTDVAAAIGTSPACHASAAAAFASISAEEAAAFARAGQGRRLKGLCRRHLRLNRNDALTYSGAFRHVAW